MNGKEYVTLKQLWVKWGKVVEELERKISGDMHPDVAKIGMEAEKERLMKCIVELEGLVDRINTQ